MRVHVSVRALQPGGLDVWPEAFCTLQENLCSSARLWSRPKSAFLRFVFFLAVLLLLFDSSSTPPPFLLPSALPGLSPMSAVFV